MTTQTNQIALYQGVEVEKAAYMAAFSQEKGLQFIIEQITQQAKAHAAELPTDMSVKKNRTALASLARSVASAKTAIDGEGKSLVEDAKAKIKVVDNNRKMVRDALDNLRDSIRQPVTEWEEEQKRQEEAIQATLEYLDLIAKATGDNGQHIDSTMLKQRLHNSNLQNYLKHENEAIRIKASEAAAQLKEAITIAEQYEAQQAEIARLEAEKAAREKAEYEAKIAAEAAEQARLEAEQRAKAEREAQERAKIEAEIKAEQAEAEKQAALARLEAEKQAAVEAERERIEAEQRAKEEAEARRAANFEHQRTINRGILTVMLDCGIDEDAAKAFLLKVVKGEVSNLKIIY